MTAYRLYWWVTGVSQDRVGGPWWVADFDTAEDRQTHVDALGPTLHRAVVCEVEPGASTGYPHGIRPPADGRELLQEDGQWQDRGQ